MYFNALAADVCGPCVITTFLRTVSWPNKRPGSPPAQLHSAVLEALFVSWRRVASQELKEAVPIPGKVKTTSGGCQRGTRRSRVTFLLKKINFLSRLQVRFALKIFRLAVRSSLLHASRRDLVSSFQPVSRSTVTLVLRPGCIERSLNKAGE